jgi:hypothetical protein
MKTTEIISRVKMPYMGTIGYIYQNKTTKKYWYSPKSPMSIMYPTYTYEFVEQNL